MLTVHELLAYKPTEGILMKNVTKTLLCLLSLTTLSSAQFTPLFDGKTLEGWSSNEEKPNCFSVVDGTIRVQGGRAHLFYSGPVAHAKFKDFELTAKVKTTPGSNSGLYFHTQFQETNWPAKGYECQINTSHKDKRKTGSLYAIQDIFPAPSKDGEWFDYRIKVEGKHILIQVDGITQVDWTEPEDWTPPPTMPGRVLSEGTFCIQGHDPKSTVFIKDIQVKVLPQSKVDSES